MIDFIVFFFSEVWNHRRNRFIAVGGLAVFFIGLTFVLVKIPGVPDWLSRVAAAMMGTFILATLALAFYYMVKFVVVGMIRVSRAVIARGKRAGHDVPDRKNLG